MTSALLITAGVLLLLMMLAGTMLLRDLRLEQSLATRVRIIHGQAPTRKSAETREVLRGVLTQLISSVGALLLRSGLVPANTRSELEQMLASSGLRGPQGVGVFLGSKIICPFVLAALAWVMAKNVDILQGLDKLFPPAVGVIGIVIPDWIVGGRRKRYLARVAQGLPDALDMMVICTQAGLGLGPAVVRVASELQNSYRELAIEFAQTANELQIMSDSRVALANLGSRTGIESFRRFGTTLIQAIQYGTPISDALRLLSAELRQEMLTSLEERAARLPVMLTMPMIVFILPCVFIIAGGPAMMQVTKIFR